MARICPHTFLPVKCEPPKEVLKFQQLPRGTPDAHGPSIYDSVTPPVMNKYHQTRFADALTKKQWDVEKKIHKVYLKPGYCIHCDLKEILHLRPKNQFKALVPGAMHLRWKPAVLQVTLSNEKKAPPIP
ncbi:unnamed protein product [Dovyalis caffra]|uniref:Uncharacterized protein n=1 Tax=Dovyalis caffra TaxID=77055 RepID=A0AAV1RD54_9ROSI|nr:unnamed protein product [Dovyalis caffra]